MEEDILLLPSIVDAIEEAFSVPPENVITVDLKYGFNTQTKVDSPSPLATEYYLKLGVEDAFRTIFQINEDSYWNFKSGTWQQFTIDGSLRMLRRMRRL